MLGYRHVEVENAGTDAVQGPAAVRRLRSAAVVDAVARRCSLDVAHLGNTGQRSDTDPVLHRDMSASDAGDVAGAEDTAVTPDVDDAEVRAH